MCVDTFMFGSCCAHNSTVNTIHTHKVPQNKPQVLYTPPSQNSQNLANKPTKPVSHYSTSKPKTR